MRSRVRIVVCVAVLSLLVIAAVTLRASSAVPETPISKILNYRTSLELTDSQVKKLAILENAIKEKMIQLRGQAHIRKAEIDRISSDWSNFNGSACCQLVKEYYDFIAELKVLEVDAIMKARAILTPEQLRKYGELASLESMMIELEPKSSLSF